MTAPKFEDVQLGYRNLWNKCVVNPGQLHDADGLAKVIIDHQPIYQSISEQTGVPWFVVGVIHMRESSFNFATHLHNGDSLAGYTHQEPPGRPRVGHGPPFTFVESAVDALTMRGLQHVSEWSLERILYELEAYNGWGYFLYHGTNSPYLWSWTNLFQRGKYIADGKWDANFIDPQPGCAAVLKRLAVADSTVAQALGSSAPDQGPVQPSSSETPFQTGPFPAEQSSRPFRYSGVLKFGGQDWQYATGGLGRGSCPYGTWEITPEAIGPVGRRLGAVGIANGVVDDPKYPGQPREGIELHPGASTTVPGLKSEGCLVLLPSAYGTFKSLLLSEVAKEPQYLTITSDGNASIGPLSPPVTQPETQIPPATSTKPKEPPLADVKLPNLDLDAIEQTIEHFEFLAKFSPLPNTLAYVKVAEAILKLASAIQKGGDLSAALPILKQLVADFEALVKV